MPNNNGTVLPSLIALAQAYASYAQYTTYTIPNIRINKYAISSYINRKFKIIGINPIKHRTIPLFISPRYNWPIPLRK